MREHELYEKMSKLKDWLHFHIKSLENQGYKIITTNIEFDFETLRALFLDSKTLYISDSITTSATIGGSIRLGNS